jgi:hypothetical protein
LDIFVLADMDELKLPAARYWAWRNEIFQKNVISKPALEMLFMHKTWQCVVKYFR